MNAEIISKIIDDHGIPKNDIHNLNESPREELHHFKVSTQRDFYDFKIEIIKNLKDLEIRLLKSISAIVFGSMLILSTAFAFIQHFMK